MQPVRGVMRRQVLATGLALAAAGRTRAAGSAVDTPTNLQRAAEEACIYLFPLMELASHRVRQARAGRGRTNVFEHLRTRTSPATQTVTSPNNDTLSSRTFLDLSAGPVEVTLPVMGERYFCLQLMDAWTNTFAVLGTRTTGPDGGRYVVVGPQHGGPSRAIRSPTNLVWVLGRTLIDGEADLPAAHALQDQYAIRAPGDVPAPLPVAARDAPWAEYFASGQEQLLVSPPPATDDSQLHRIARLGLTAQGGFDPARFTSAQGAQIAMGVETARRRIRAVDAGYRIVSGWSYFASDIGAFGQDYLFRAQVALWGIGALIPQEAMYLRAAGDDDSPFFAGGSNYRLHFPAGQTPPVDAFWSLTLYRVTDEGQQFFFANPLDRYSLGDRSGLARHPDGSVDVYFRPTDPGGERTRNWLPIPASGRFGVLLRAYQPRREFVEGTYRIPPIKLDQR